MATNISIFAPAPVGLNEIHNSGSFLLVAPLTNEQDGTTGPTEATITIPAVTLGATSISVTSSVEKTVAKGTRLAVGSNYVVVAETTVIGTSATTVPIEPAPAAFAGGSSTTWGLQRILSPTNLPLTDQSQTVDRKDLTFGLQGSMVKVGVTFQPQITVIAAPADVAFWEVIYPAKNTANRIYAHIYRNGGLHAFGAAFVTNMTVDGNINEITRPQFTLEFQAPFALPTLAAYLSAEEKAVLNEVCAKSGLPTYA